MSLLELDPATGTLPVNEADLNAWDNMFKARAVKKACPDSEVYEVLDPNIEGGYKIIKFDEDSSAADVEADLSAATGHMVLKVVDDSKISV